MKSICLIVLSVFFYSCNEKKTEDLVKESININKIKMPLVVHRTENNRLVKDIKNIVIFKNTSELLQISNENFYTILIKEDENIIEIGISHYKSGFDFCTKFDKKDEFKIISNNIIQTKRGESKPYYVYWAIMRKKYPKLMNWNQFYIPKDSLK